MPSPSALSNYLACPHLANLELQVAAGDLVRPEVDDPQTELIRRKGEEHEEAYLEQLRAAGKSIREIELPRDAHGVRNYESGMAEVAAAMREGVDVIYQAPLVHDGWRGVADFLERQPDGTYEAVDTKLARHGKPSHVLQLCFYSEQLGRLQDKPPQRMHLAVGSGETEIYRSDDFMAYFRRVRSRYEAFVGDPPHTEPYPVDHCSLCDFRPLCNRWWDERDHLVRVANMRRDQIVRLGDAGIATLEQLGDTPRDTEIPRMAAPTFEALRHQAELQLRHRRTGRHFHELLPLEDERGLALLPKPSPGDLFFDMEGDPWFEPARGLEYLFGVLWVEGGETRFRPFWAHSRDEERRAFEEFVDFVHGCLRAHPDLHVYHYASYEQTALKRLMAEHATREDDVDDLLRKEVLVDLFAVVRQSLRISHPRYSIKNVEQFYMQREAELRAGDDSIVLYEKYMADGDEAVLDAIREYNREDCLSTYLLREWLLERKAEAQAAFGVEIPWREPPEVKEPKPESLEELEERERLRRELDATGDDALRLAGLLLEYHRREAKPIWWAYFRRLEMNLPELVEDAESIGGLEVVDVVEEDGGSKEYTLRFPVQQHRLGVGKDVDDPVTGKSPGSIVALDDEENLLTLRRGPKVDKRPLPQALIPTGAWNTTAQRRALMRLACSLRDGSGRYPALEGILRRELPLGGDRVQVETLDEAKRLVELVEGRHLFVQGPPGSGKTWQGARLIVHLLEQGKRVGVTSTSHKAIHNLLCEIEAAGLRHPALKKASGDNPESFYDGEVVENEKDVEPFLDEEVRLLAGTAWLFAREELDSKLDYLFVDEAGQVSLADALAVGTAARTIVLLGDPVQLAQVTQGVHPGGSGASVLEHLLGDAKTIPEDRGLFLAQTYRMHPEVCRFVSDAFYEGRLHSAHETLRQGTQAGVGPRFLPVEHEGNRVFSPEEASRIRDEIEALVGLDWTDSKGKTSPLGYEDFMVVAPYNEQVRELREALPRRVPVGTVDKFQGQQAPVVFFSMTTSSGEDVPRNLAFLLSRNRLNVAVSRARCLAYVVASPKLLEVGCRSIEQMRMANALCLFAELAERERAAA